MNTHQAAHITDALSGTVGLVIGCFLLFLALSWLLLPLVLMSSIGKLRKEVQAMHASLGELVGVNTRTNLALDKIAAHLRNIDAGTDHTHALLKWIGEQRPADPEQGPS
jgi:uncharacterized protein YqgC (DUF456 family)